METFYSLRKVLEHKINVEMQNHLNINWKLICAKQCEPMGKNVEHIPRQMLRNLCFRWSIKYLHCQNPMILYLRNVISD